MVVRGGLLATMAALALATTSFAKTRAGSQVETGHTEKERSNMKTLDLTIKLKRDKVITGESLPIEVTLENRSPSPVEVPDPRVESKFLYTLRSQSDPAVVHHLSAAQAHADRYLEPKRSRGLPGLQLAPGAKQVYNEDLAQYEVTPIHPGAYALVVGYNGVGGLAECAAVPISIAPPRPSRMVTLAGATEKRIAVVFAQPSDAKHASVYQIENAAGRPGDGAAYPRKEGVGIAELRGLAVAIDLASSQGRRWLAWLEGGVLGAGVGNGRYISRLVEPVAHGLHGASLGPVGWQLSDDDALFIVLGAEAGGKGILAAATFHLTAPGVVKTIPVAGPANPEAWAAQYHVSGSDAQIELVMATRTGHMAKITRQTIALGSGKAGAPATLVERPSALTAMAMAPVGLGGNPVVDVLFGPDPKTSYMSLVRLPLAGGAAGTTWDFSPPKNTGGKRPTAWAIPRTPLEPRMAATHVGDKIYVRRAGGDWAVVVDGVPHVEHLALEALREGGVVAVWSDPAFGIRYQAVP
jgi:hypothetical protein